MSDARHYSFNPLKTIGKGLGLGLILLSAGCASTSFDKLTLADSGTGKNASSLTTGSIKAATLPKTPQKSPLAGKKKSILALLEAVTTNGSYPGDKSNPKTVGNSAWCRYLDATAKVESTILRSPTIAGDVNDEGNGGVSVSYDFVDLARANIKEEAAGIRCKRYQVSNRLARMMIIAPQSLTLAGNRAKADYLKSKRGELAAIRRKIKQHINKGEMTVQLGTALMQHSENIASAEFRARAEVLRRSSIGKMESGTYVGLDSELADTERALQEIDRRSRSIEAIKVSLSAGYGYQGDSGFTSNSGYGKIKLSYRIGAASPRRQQYEDIAAQARVDALSEKNRGLLWRSNEMSQAINRAYNGVVAQRKQLIRALSEARRNTVLYVKGYEIEMLQPRYRAQIDAIAFEAELRGIDATLVDMRRVARNLSFQ